MKLTTKGRYGVKAILDLALQQSEEPIALKSIAIRQDISENYLEQLFATLRRAGFVKSVREPKGLFARKGSWGYHNRFRTKGFRGSVTAY